MNRRNFVSMAAAALVFRRWPRLEERLVERWSWVMGQPVRISLYARSEQLGLDAAALALGELRRIDGALTLFDPASDLVALNERAGRGPVRAGPDLLRALRHAEALKARTGGAFDPAVEPLMRAWGFRGARSAPPTTAELSEALHAVAATGLHLTERSARLESRSAQLDLGGIGVGYGLDRAGRVLRDAGITRALLDISGDFLALGAPPGSSGWEIAIAGRHELSGRTVLICDEALATSANHASVVRYGPLTVGHVLDPKRGTAACGLAQVTVVAKTATEADGLSTAMLVSGKQYGGVSGLTTPEISDCSVGLPASDPPAASRA